METLFSKNYLPFGCRVRRKQLPGEPGDRETGWIAGANLAGTAHFVFFGKGSQRKMVLIDTGELEVCIGTEAR
jgi:hypothetical protein